MHQEFIFKQFESWSCCGPDRPILELSSTAQSRVDNVVIFIVALGDGCLSQETLQPLQSIQLSISQELNLNLNVFCYVDLLWILWVE